MLDIIFIQHQKSGIRLLEYRQEHTKFQEEHSDIFSGFMSAIQNITRELNIGVLVLISTEGAKGHNCIIVHEPPINVIILVDQNDPVDLWRKQGSEIAERFIEKYGVDFNPHHLNIFYDFISVIKEMCADHEYCT